MQFEYEISDWRHATLKDDNGSVIDSDYDFDVKEIEYIAQEKEYDTRWDRDAHWTIFVTKDGKWGLYSYIPAGYSSYTYDPDESIELANNFNTLWNMVLDNENRERFSYIHGKIFQYLNA